MTTQQLISNEKFLCMIAHAANTYTYTITRTHRHINLNTNTITNEKPYFEKAFIAGTQVKKNRQELNKSI